LGRAFHYNSSLAFSTQLSAAGFPLQSLTQIQNAIYGLGLCKRLVVESKRTMKNKLLIICLCFCLGCKQQKKPNQQNENGQTVATPLVLEDYAQLKKEMLQKQQ
jgi:hypothetical protein